MTQNTVNLFSEKIKASAKTKLGNFDDRLEFGYIQTKNCKYLGLYHLGNVNVRVGLAGSVPGTGETEVELVRLRWPFWRTGVRCSDAQQRHSNNPRPLFFLILLLLNLQRGICTIYAFICRSCVWELKPNRM